MGWRQKRRHAPEDDVGHGWVTGAGPPSFLAMGNYYSIIALEQLMET